MGPDRIDRIDCMTVALPLSRPVWAAGLRIERREFFVVRITTASGIEGVGFHKSRGLVLDRVVTDLLAPLLRGQDPCMVQRLWQSMYQATLLSGRTGAVMRALGTVDIALWDLKSKAAALPLHRLLGGYRDRCRALLVTGYYEQDPHDLEPMVEDMQAHRAEGFDLFKIAGGMLDDSSELKRLETARETLGPGIGLVVDVNWVWHDLKRALRSARNWEAYDLDWIEEPFPPGSTSFRQRFAAQSPVPVGIGDEQAGVPFFRDLMAGQLADVIRVDTPVLGGITPALKVIALADAYGLPVSPHIYPEINLHLAAAFENVIAVETFSPRSELYQIDRFISPSIEYADGEAAASAAPGLGFELAWNELAAHAI